ncbi:MAG: hypothetical protein IPO83_01930 [Chitinophagaceae bacterium]|nr:hypothetical protein [Chitinophagaceae bacterium]
MKGLNLKMLASLAFVALSGLFTINTSYAQDRIPREAPEVEAQREKMPYDEYNRDVRTRYQNVLDQVDRIQKQMAEKKIDDPKFRKALSKFEARAKSFGERMENAKTIPAEDQEKYRKKMRSELEKLHKEYDRLLDHWEDMKK